MIVGSQASYAPAITRKKQLVKVVFNTFRVAQSFAQGFCIHLQFCCHHSWQYERFAMCAFNVCCNSICTLA